MNFYIQDPLFESSYTLHEALLEASNEALTGASAYAFVSLEGIKLLLEDSVFHKLLLNGTFTLVVGIDEITSENALIKLKETQSEFKDFKVFAFLHNTSGSLFHPKFSWFRYREGGSLILGSGNLTGKGLRHNREAFIYDKVDEETIDSIEKYWNEWLQKNEQYLRNIDDDEVLYKVRENDTFNSHLKEARSEYKTQQSEGDLPTEADEKRGNEEVELNAWSYTDNNDVLVAEIPRNGDRITQVNFDRNSFANFFGANPGVNGEYRILLRHVDANGMLSDLETRGSVSVKSSNWRFELKGRGALDYPTEGRPIAIFIKISTRAFIYHLLLPTEQWYGEIMTFLDELNSNNTNVRRESTTVASLRENCPDLPILNFIER